MALTDIQLRKAKPRRKPYELADGKGLIAEVMPSGTIAWRFRYRLNGRREKVSIGKYPAKSLAMARAKAAEYAAQVEAGRSPMREKRAAKVAVTTPQIFELFARKWLDDVVEKARKDAHQIRRYLERDVFPTLGQKRLEEITPTDILALTDRIKARGSEQSALLLRNILKRLFAYAIARQVTTNNPAAVIQARYIATAKSRDRALSRDEVGRLLRTIYRSSMRTSNKVALHLLLITMVRKAELVEAKWEDVDFERGEWEIPETKSRRPHIVYLSEQAKELFQELRAMAGDSPYVLPSRSNPQKPIADSTLNTALRALDLDVSGFVIHDFRRTASTHLHEPGFQSDVIERALNHTIGGVRGVYNRAAYAEQRRRMLQQWADMVEQWMRGAEVQAIGDRGKAT